jgi:hypothetical protein
MAQSGRTFTAVVQRPDDGPGHAVALPFDPRTVFGRVRVPVVVTIAGHEPFRTRIAGYGGTAWIGLRKAQLTEFELAVGDEVTMTVQPDDAPGVLELPAELASALAADPVSSELFEGLAFSHRREYADWVREAKQSSTRERRAAQTVQRIKGQC